jgi:hypothetical protein
VHKGAHIICRSFVKAIMGVDNRGPGMGALQDGLVNEGDT